MKKQLEAWQVEIQVPSGFQREVWARIAARAGERERSPLRRLLAALPLRIVEPAIAGFLVLLALSAGLVAAHTNAREANERHWVAMQTHYLASLDPYAHLAGR